MRYGADTCSTDRFHLDMSSSLFGRLAEAQELLKEVKSWSEDEIEELPKFYREKARRFRQLAQMGEE